MRVSFSPPAVRQIDEIFNNCIARENPAAAQKAIDRIYAVVARVADYPKSGHPTGLRNIRAFPLLRCPYLVFFRRVPGRDEVRILRVRHAARRPLGLDDPAAEFVGQISS